MEEVEEVDHDGDGDALSAGDASGAVAESSSDGE